MINFVQAATIAKKELVDSIRDRRTLITSVIMPIVLMPAILIGSVKFQEYQARSLAEKPVLIGINDESFAPTLTQYLQKTAKAEFKQVSNPNAAIESGEIYVFMDVPDNFESLLAKNEPALVRIKHKSSKVDSTTGFTKVTTALSAFNTEQSAIRLTSQGLDVKILSAVVPEVVDVSTPEERGGYFLGYLLPMFIVLFAIVGGMYIAIDVSAGEKERKTLEALLLTPASRLTIVTGKFIAVAATASVTIVLSLASLYSAFKLFPPNFDGTGQIVVNITFAALGLMLLLGVILAVMFSGLLLSVAIFAKSYKEAQNYITPFYLLAILPVAILGQIPGFNPTVPIFFIPGVNAVFVMKEILLGVFDMSHIMVTFVSLLIFAVIAVVVSGKIYSKESILFRD